MRKSFIPEGVTRGKGKVPSGEVPEGEGGDLSRNLG